MHLNRRKFVAGASGLAFVALANNLSSNAFAGQVKGLNSYGPLIEDPDKLLDLPRGFSYQIISQLGDEMDGGFKVPARADGMGCIALEDNKVALIRNHEIDLDNHDPLETAKLKPFADAAYDTLKTGEPLPGGTTTIIYDVIKREKISEYYSLLGTLRNCAGGITPWGSWLSCEETMRKAGDDVEFDHGWVFEVPTNTNDLKKIEPIKEMGRFNHEAAAVDPRTSIVYLTEDRPNSLFYRFIPNVKGQLSRGGKLQALSLVGDPGNQDTRNWDGVIFAPGSWHQVKWVDLHDTDSPVDDLRVRGHKDGATLFARGEGIHWGDDELYFCCTTGGAENVGQVMRYQPSPDEGTSTEKDNPGKLQLFVESTDKSTFGLGDNLTVAPNGHLIVCEDHYDNTPNHMRGITPEGEIYPLAKVVIDSETAGACFSPDGEILFVNIQNPTVTLAITGPWDSFNS